MRELIGPLAAQLGMNAEDQAKLLPSGGQTVLGNRVYWAGTYLRKAGLLVAMNRGTVRVTEEGTKVLAQNPPRIDKTFLSQYPSFHEFAMGSVGQAPSPAVAVAVAAPPAVEVSPEEQIEAGWQEIRSALAQDLLEKVKGVSPHFFEKLVVDLLLAMGYGGSRSDASRLVGRSGDAGIDGTISEDKLGLDVVYVQAKRWEGSVGREIVQAFAGSLEGFRARKGVLITTSRFSSTAQDYVQQIEKKIVLIDGARLVDLMIEHRVGVDIAKTYDLKKIDQDYFDDDGALP